MSPVARIRRSPPCFARAGVTGESPGDEGVTAKESQVRGRSGGSVGTPAASGAARLTRASAEGPAGWQVDRGGGGGPGGGNQLTERRPPRTGTRLARPFRPQR